MFDDDPVSTCVLGRCGASSRGGDRLPTLTVSRQAFQAFSLVVGLLFALDVATKRLAETRLPLGGDAHLAPSFALVHVDNTGTALGLLPAPTEVIGVVGVVVAGVLAAWHARPDARRWARVPAALVCGGALGNAAERLGAGRVTDFVAIGQLPAFNLADVFVVSGLALLIAGRVAQSRGSRPSS